MNKLAIALTSATIMLGGSIHATAKPVCVADNTTVATADKYLMTNRPAKSKRLFHSKAVDAKIAEVKIGRAHV